MRGKRWMAVVLVVGLSLLSAGPAVAHGHRGHHHTGGVTVGGAVTTPHTYSRDELNGLAQPFTDVDRTDVGVSLDTLVGDAVPTLPITKNALLRVTVTVSGESRRFGRDRPVTFALGELDQNFGNHPAYLTLAKGSHVLRDPELIVPGDAFDARTVRDVSSITVGVQSSAPTAPPTTGALTIQDNGRSVVLTAAQLAALPARTVQVSFLAGMSPSPQQHTEVGPTLDTVLRAADLRADLDTWVAAVGSDGYVATVTPAEAWIGDKQLLVSLNEDGQPLAQPRLVVGGDVKGGRYVSGVDDLVLGRGPAPLGR